MKVPSSAAKAVDVLIQPLADIKYLHGQAIIMQPRVSRSRNAGMSPLLSSVLLVSVILVSTLLVMSQLLPSMKSMVVAGAISEGKQALSAFDRSVQELAYEAPGAKRVVTFRTSEGKFRVLAKDDSVRFSIYSEVQDIDPGSIRKEGNIMITYGPGVNAYESDINGDGETDLVISNDALTFAVRKMGNSTGMAFMNLSNASSHFITAFRNNLLGINMSPVVGIYINGIAASNYGNGYTELVESGTGMEEAAIRLYMNSSSGYVYEAFFRLLPGTDFIESDIKLR